MKARKILMVSTALATLALATSTAQAASTYASIFGGVGFLNSQTIKGSAHSGPYATTFSGYNYYFDAHAHESLGTSFKTGFVVGGNFGIDWGDFRTELELAYRENTSGNHGHLTTKYTLDIQNASHSVVAHYTTTQDREVPTHLRLKAFSLMANAWYDFHDLDLPWGLTPYVGGGIGLAQVGIDGTIDGNRIRNKDDIVFAWQLGAGASMPIADHTSLFVDYRYFAADSAGLAFEPGPQQFIGNAGVPVKANFDSHSVLLGIRFNFS